MADGKVLIDDDKRLIYFYADVQEEFVADACFAINQWNMIDDENEKTMVDYVREPIHFYISSTGGELYNMWSLIDTIELSKTPVYTYCAGCVQSSGFIIYLAGEKRFASRHSNFMYHQIYMTRSGPYNALVEDREQQDYLQMVCEEYVVERTKISTDIVENIRKRNREHWFHLDDAIKLGIVTDVLK